MNEYLLSLLQDRINTDNLKTILYLFNILDESGLEEVVTSINNIGNIDSLDIDLTTLDKKVIFLLREGIRVYLKHRGIFCDDEVLSTVPLSFIETLIQTLKQINDIDTDQAEEIIENLPTTTTDSIELLEYFLTSINTEIDVDIYYNLVTDVYSGAIASITKIIENIANTEVIDNNDKPDIDASLIISFASDNNISTLPTLVDDFITNKEATIQHIKHTFTDLKISEFKIMNFTISEFGIDERAINKSLMSLVLIYYYGSHDWYNTLLLDLIDKSTDEFDYKTNVDKILEVYTATKGMLDPLLGDNQNEED